MADKLQLQNTIQIEHAETIFGIDFHQFSVSFVVADLPEGDDGPNGSDTLERLADALESAGWQFQAAQIRRAARQFAERKESE